MRTLVGLTMAALVALAAAQAFAPRDTPPLAATRLAVDKMHFNTLATSSAGLLAGGELGHILISRDKGKSWQPTQLSNDRQALITQIFFDNDGLTGMAVGHESWILGTRDGGLTWTELHFQEKNGEPLMSVARLPSGKWLAVGSFGRAIESVNEGRDWTAVEFPDAQVEDKHLNRIVGSVDGQHWLIVGERGLVLRSDNQGLDWKTVPEFYNGSFYNALSLPNGGWLVYGMRGNAYVNQGDAHWTQASIPAPVAFFGHAVLPDGRLLLVGQGSVLATSSNQGAEFSLTRLKGRVTLTDIQLQPDGTAWITSDAGLQMYRTEPTEAAKASNGVTP